MGISQLQFGDRLNRLNKRRRKMARNGVVHSVNHDGLIIAKAKRRAPRFPIKGLVLVFISVIAYKGFLHAYLGGAVYEQRLSQLTEGNGFERFGGWVMQLDPATIWVSGKMQAIIR